jgi:hypothetical protein
VIGGAFVAAAFYLILLALGAGFGLSAISPWSNVGASASTVGTAAIIWLVFIEIVAPALGGYLTGRLRTKWALIHTDEVYFRDTANGFLAWAVALVISVTFLTSAAASMVGSIAESRSSAETGTAAGTMDPNEYFVDALFRSSNSGAESTNACASRGWPHPGECASTESDSSGRRELLSKRDGGQDRNQSARGRKASFGYCRHGPAKRG